MNVLLGDRELTFPGNELGELRDCNDCLENVQALRKRLDEDGYLLIREFFDRELILTARRAILEFGRDYCHDILKPGTDLEDAIVNPKGRVIRTNGNRDVTHKPGVLAVLENNVLFEFFHRFFDTPARTFDHKWLRFTGPGRSAGPHYDNVYMGRGSLRLHTCWIPFGEYTPDMSTLAVLVGSHNLPAYEKVRNTYGKTDVDRDFTPGQFSKDPVGISQQFGGQWKTTRFQPGDILILTMFTMHTSTKNRSDRWRLSSDIRFQPAEDPVDERWIGDTPVAHSTRDGSRPPLTMEEAREQWGV